MVMVILITTINLSLNNLRKITNNSNSNSSSIISKDKNNNQGVKIKERMSMDKESSEKTMKQLRRSILR